MNRSRAVMSCALLLAGCGEAPKKVEAPPRDPTIEASYGEAVAELAAAGRRAKALIAAGKNDAAAAVITHGQPLIATVLAAPHPTLAAMEAASDLDELYGQMLLANKNYGWARMLFQKNRSRWMHWTPQTEDTARRRKQADAAIAECDRAIAK
ncbi:MAG TPA: hypothetical protein VGF49_14885 [Candidatus Solibacter sp.]